MISKSGEGYWTTGITVRSDGGGWGASLRFLDDGFCDDDADAGQVSSEGELRTRYFVKNGSETSGLRAALDTLIGDAGRLGIRFVSVADAPPYLSYEGDGENPKWPPPPGWRETLAAEAERLGWQGPTAREG
jgi:hypothetical protein